MKKIFVVTLALACCITLCSCYSLYVTSNLMSADNPMLSHSVNVYEEEAHEYEGDDETEYAEQELEVEQEEPKVYFEGFDVTLEEGTYDAPAHLSFVGNEGASVYYAFSDGELTEDGEITGIPWDGSEIPLPAGTFTLRAMCLDGEGNTKTILRSYTVNRNYSLINYEDVAQNGYFDYVVIRDIRDLVYVFDRFTGELEEVKKFPEANAISHIVARSNVRSTRDEMGAELYDKIMGTVPAGAAQSVKKQVVKDELYVFVKNYDALDGMLYSYIDGEQSGEEREYSVFYPDNTAYAIPEEYATVQVGDVTLHSTAIIGNYVFCRDYDSQMSYIHDLNTGETVENNVIAQGSATLVGVTSNAAYYKFVEDGYYSCTRVDYDEIGSLFFGR